MTLKTVFWLRPRKPKKVKTFKNLGEFGRLLMETNASEKIQSERRKKGNRFVFAFTLISMIFQTVFTFVLLLETTEENAVLTKITTWLFIIYAISFIVMTMLSLRSRRYEKESVAVYRSSMKWFKRMIKLMLVVLSIMNIITAVKIDIFALISAVILLIVNIFLISLDFFVAGVKFKIRRKLKKWKQKRNAKID